MMVTRQTLQVTPDMASSFLSKNTDNRPLSRTTVRAFAAAMKRGEWRYNGDSIRFSQSGRLLDGQHRLHAVVSSGVPIEVDVIKGLPDDVFVTLDVGKRRNVADTLTISGEKNSSVLGSAARAFARVGLGVEQSLITTPYLIEVIEKHPTLRWWSNKHASTKCKAFMPSSFAGVCAIYAEKYGTDPIYSFFESVAEGTGLSKGDPALTLRDRFMERKRGQVIGQELALAYFIKALNAFVQGKKLVTLRMFNDEKFPEVV